MAVDLIVHRRNSKGEIVGFNPYSLHIINGVKVYEQPKGHYQFENGEPCKHDGSPLDKPVVVEQPKAQPSQPFAKGK